jgi:hypothetical protein
MYINIMRFRIFSKDQKLSTNARFALGIKAAILFGAKRKKDNSEKPDPALNRQIDS